jgi:hypothetical protein
MRGNGVSRCIDIQGAIAALTRPSATVAAIPETPASGLSRPDTHEERMSLHPARRRRGIDDGDPTRYVSTAR